MAVAATARVHSERTREEMADAGARLLPLKRSRPESESAASVWSGKQQRFEGQPRDINSNRDARSVFNGGERELYEEAAGLPVIQEHVAGGNGQPMTPSLLQSLSASAAASYFTWRLPANQGLDASEQYLNEQLVHVAGSAAFEMSSTARVTGLGGPSAQDQGGDDEAAICQLNLTKSVWGFINGQIAYTTVGKEKLQKEKDEAEKRLRETMDLISLLLYLRSQELVRQNELGERLAMLEKELQRRKHQAQALTGELETNKQSLAQQENYFRAKELAFMNERKTLLTEKRSLEVMVARLQGVETSFKAQLRRKDAEYERLRKSLQDSVARSSKEQRV